MTDEELRKRLEGIKSEVGCTQLLLLFLLVVVSCFGGRA